MSLMQDKLDFMRPTQSDISLNPGALLLRATEEFWGELWARGPIEHTEILARSESGDWMSELVEFYDEDGALREARIFDYGKIWRIMKYEYGLSNCLAKKTNQDLETGIWTSWEYQESTMDGWPVYIAEVSTNRTERPQL